MKVVVIGGLGSMGQAVARDLVKQDMFERIIIADIVIDKERIHDKLRNDARVLFEKVDLYDHQRLLDVIRGASIVVNCAGPFYKTTIPVVRAALEAKANYIDICDDYEATEMLFSASEINDLAKESGVTVLTGMGSDPGTNNILVKWYADKLDVVDEIRLYWVVSIAEISGAAMDHSLHMVLGKVPQYINGRLENVEAGEGEEALEFLPPLGECTVRFVGHPQPITIPRYITGVKTVLIKGGLIPRWVDDYIMKQKEMGFLEREKVAMKDVTVEPYEFTLNMWNKLLALKDKGPQASGLKVIVRGKEGDSLTEYTADIVGKMAPGTGLPAAIGTAMMAKGMIEEKGVVAPEGCIDPREFLSEFIKRGARIVEKKTQIRTLDLEKL